MAYEGSEAITSIVILHTEQGDAIPNVQIIGGKEVRVFWVDENCPNDRVFEMTSRSNPSVFRELIPEGTEIGHAGDDRHEAIANKINAFLDGRSPFSVIDGDDNG